MDLEDYDASAMPEMLDTAARNAFTPYVPDLGEGEFFAGDAGHVELPPEHYDKASLMSITYGGDTPQELELWLSHARSEAESDPQRYCESGLEGGLDLECTADMGPDGTSVVTRLMALKPYARDWMGVRSNQIANADPDELWFTRSVKVVKSETFYASVKEGVKASSREAAERLPPGPDHHPNRPGHRPPDW